MPPAVPCQTVPYQINVPMAIVPCETPSGDDAIDASYGAALAPGERRLASYAASRAHSRGRLLAEPPCPTRNAVQRDRDRVLHSTAFRRLIYKTQMFVFHEGDHYRTRLTHSLEVAQIARTLARQLCLDEDLAEALALAHDLGHPPFGHAGERALDGILASVGGFDHNVQSFRIVTKLERKYAAFDGLNLCWETLEGLIKHNGPPIAGSSGSSVSADPRLVHAVRHVDADLARTLGAGLELSLHASGEAQVAAVADDIAWMTHDIDDGLRAGLIAVDDLADVPVLSAAMASIAPTTGAANRRIYEVVRRLITDLIADVVTQSRSRLAALAPRHPDDIRRAGHAVIAFSPRSPDRARRLAPVPVCETVSARAGDARDGRGPGRAARPRHALHRRSGSLARGMAQQRGRTGRASSCAVDRRFRRGHDRPVCDRGTSPIVCGDAGFALRRSGICRLHHTPARCAGRRRTTVTTDGMIACRTRTHP